MIYEFIYTIFIAYATLFPVLNPLGGCIFFNSITYPLDFEVKKKLARRIAINAFFLLVGVLFLGTWILKLFGIQIPIVQIGGGAIVATRGWMIMNTGVRTNNMNTDVIIDEAGANSASFFPLTLPITAGPGAITAAITLGAEAQSFHPKEINLPLFMDYAGFTLGILLSAMTVFLAYHYAGYLIKRIGESGRMVIMKLSAFITLCIGLSIVWKGVQGLVAFYVKTGLS